MKRVAIDFGSSETKICISGSGVVLKEATCVAVEQAFGDEGRYVIKALGDKARALSGRAAVNTRIVNPVFEGDIVHENIAAALLAYFLNKIEITKSRAKRTEVIFFVHCVSGDVIKDKY